MKTLIIGFGSTLRRDDGVGFMVAETLMDVLGEDAAIARHQLTPDLADEVSRAEEVIFIDACAQTPPGQIAIVPVTPKGENWGAFVHEMSPEVLLDCVKELYGRIPAARLIKIGGEDFSIGEGLTPAVADAMQKVIADLTPARR